jgi:hypothetical protein
VREQLRQAASDDVAQKGWNAGKRRTRFVDWTAISLHPMLSPAPLINKESYRESDGISNPANYLEQRALGSSVFLSSCVLGKEFISLVRPWMRSRYGMVRNAQMLAPSHNEMVRNSRSLAMIAGPWFAHEMKALLNKNALMRAQPGNCSEQSVALAPDNPEYRTIRIIACVFCHSRGLAAECQVVQQLKEKFQAPLRSLAAGPGLKDALMAVARTVYHDVRLNKDPTKMESFPRLRRSIRILRVCETTISAFVSY